MKLLKHLRLPIVASAFLISCSVLFFWVLTRLPLPPVDTKFDETRALAFVAMCLLMVFYLSCFGRAVLLFILVIVVCWMVYGMHCLWRWYKKKYLDPKEGTHVRPRDADTRRIQPRRLAPSKKTSRRRRRDSQDTMRFSLDDK